MGSPTVATMLADLTALRDDLDRLAGTAAAVEALSARLAAVEDWVREHEASKNRRQAQVDQLAAIAARLRRSSPS